MIKEGKKLYIDPRIKLLMLICCVLFGCFAPNLLFQLGLVAVISIVGLAMGEWKKAFRGLIGYILICIFTVWIMGVASGTIRTMFVAFLGLFHKVYACGMLAGIFISTTKVNEFMYAMGKLKLPKTIIIPMAVMIRYVPAIREDWRSIKDAMRLRDINLSFLQIICHPIMSAECIYVPLMMSSSKAADELTIAAVTRGIEAPGKRTCLLDTRLSKIDYLLCTFSIISVICEVIIKNVGI